MQQEEGSTSDPEAHGAPWRRVFWTKYGRRESTQKVFYHCSRSCLKPRHPYFKSRELTIVDKVTADDIELAKRHGVDLSFVTLKDTE